jgi:exopolysaccharide biosynthesis protein
MRRTEIVVLFLFWLGLALVGLGEESFSTVKSVSHTLKDGKLRIVVETTQPEPEVSVFFEDGPDRLILEFNDTLPACRKPRKPSTRFVRSLTLKRFGLNRTRLTLNLNYRPSNPELSVETLKNPPRLVVELPTTPGLREKTALTKGITWVREDQFLDGRWTRLNRLLFDPRDPDLEVVVGLAKEKTDAREELSSMVRRYDAVAGINGGFFAGQGGALGLVYRDGRMLVPHVSRRPPRSGFGLTRAGKALFGRIAAVGPNIKDVDGGDWSEAQLALGGGPRLLKSGVAKVTADLEELGPKGNDITRVAARTIVGLTHSGKVMFGTVTGYQDNHKQGTQFGPLVAWLKSLKIQEAVNFDGGASVNMVIGSHIVSDGPANRSKEKPVATALLVKDKRDRLFPHSATWTFQNVALPADGKSSCGLTVALKTPSGKMVEDGTKVRFFAQGVALEPSLATTLDGQVHLKVRSLRRPGKAKIVLMAGPLTDTKSFTLNAGTTEKLYIHETGAEPIEDQPLQRVVLKVQTVDKWGNGVPGQGIRCSVDGSEVVELVTDKLGMMAVDVDLPRSGGTFSVSHPTAGKLKHRIEPYISSQKTSHNL